MTANTKQPSPQINMPPKSAQIQKNLNAEIHTKIKELVDLLGPLGEKYKDLIEKFVKNFILGIPILGEGYGFYLDVSNTFDTLVDNLEPELNSLLLFLQLINSVLNGELKKGNNNVNMSKAVEILMEGKLGKLSGPQKQTMLNALVKIKELRDMKNSVEEKINNTAKQGLTNFRDYNNPGKQQAAGAAGGGRNKRTRTRTRRIKHGARRYPLAKSKVVKRSTRRRGR